MTQTLTDFLEEQAAGAATRQAAVVYLAAELTDDAGEQELLARARTDVARPDGVDELAQQLGTDAELLDAVVLAVLQAAWDGDDRAAVQRAVRGAKAKLPVVEIALIVAGAVAMYGMYLRATGGRSSSQKTTVRLPDGTEIESVREEMHPPIGPLAHAQQLLGLDTGAAGDPGGSEGAPPA